MCLQLFLKLVLDFQKCFNSFSFHIFPLLTDKIDSTPISVFSANEKQQQGGRKLGRETAGKQAAQLSPKVKS